MPPPRRPRRGLLLAGAAALVACLVVGCSEEPVAVGEGKMPGSVPGDFPVPAGAVIGATLLDRVNHRTEVRLSVPDEPSRVVRFFTVSLVESGYVVDDFAGDGSRFEGWSTT